MRSILILRNLNSFQLDIKELAHAGEILDRHLLAADRIAVIDPFDDRRIARLDGKAISNLASYRSKPHVLDDYTVDRVIKVYTDQADDLRLYEEQLCRWKKLELDRFQRREVGRLAAQVPTIGERIKAILSLSEELKKGTIENVLSKSDFDLGMEILLGRRKP